MSESKQIKLNAKVSKSKVIAKNKSIIDRLEELKQEVFNKKVKVLENLPQAITVLASYMETVKEEEKFKEKQLQEILDSFYVLESLFSEFISNSDNEYSDVLVNFVSSKIELLIKINTEFLELNDDAYFNWNALILEIIKRLSIIIKKDCYVKDIIKESVFNKEELFSESIFALLIRSFVEEKEYNFNISKHLNELYQEIRNDTDKTETTVLISNILNFIFSLPTIEELKKVFVFNPSNNKKSLSKNKENDNDSLNSWIQSFQDFFVSFLDDNVNNFDDYVVKQILKKLNNHLFSITLHPQALSDFILRLYKKTNEKDLKILTLNCLFTLLIKFNYVIEEYYELLYLVLFIPNILDSVYLNRLVKMIYYSLKPSSVAKSVICSFIKKLARLSLSASSNHCCKITELIEHTLYYHKKCLTLLTRKKKDRNIFVLFDIEKNQKEIMENSKPVLNNIFLAMKEDQNRNDNDNNNDDHNNSELKLKEKNDDDEDSSDDGFNKKKSKINTISNKKQHDQETEKSSKNIESIINDESNNLSLSNNLIAKYDVFNENERNPYNTKASESCLWELYALLSHFNNNVRKRVLKMSKKFIDKTLDIEPILDLKEEDCFLNISQKSNFYFNYKKISKNDTESLLSCLI